MLIRDPWDHRSPFAICCYVDEPRTWIPGELVTSGMMNSLRDLFLEIEAGTAQHQKATFVGKTSAQLDSMRSATSEAALAYDTDLDALVRSLGGGSFEALINDVVPTLTVTDGQIIFPAAQNASAGANTLDDYEEGKFTAGVSFGGATTGITYAAATTNGSTYVKWGKNILVTGYIELTSKGSASGAARITGMPFANEAGVNPLGAIGMGVAFSGLTGVLQFYLDSAAASGPLYQSAAASVTVIADTFFTNTTAFNFFVFYRAAA